MRRLTWLTAAPLLALLLGVMTTVLSTWVLVRWTSGDAWPRPVPVLVSEERVSGKVTRALLWTEWELGGEPHPKAIDAEPPSWVTVPHHEDMAVVSVGYGVPMRCLARHYGYDRMMSVPQIDDGWHVRTKSWSGVLPRSPIWSGLLVNWACYSTLVYTVMVGLRGVARFGRGRKPGRCRACGYSRAGIAARAVCPECGLAMP